MTSNGGRKRIALAALACATGLALLGAASVHSGAGAAPGDNVRSASLTVALAPPVDVIVAGDPRGGRPIVVIDPGHGGHDPGASGASGDTDEKGLALLIAAELRDRLVERGRLRVALTRTDDRYLSLDQRAAVARDLDAAALVSIHLDSAANALASGMSVYSLSDVASDSTAARLAKSENGREGAGERAGSGGVEAMLADLTLRDRMESSAALAERLIRKADGRVPLRPEPHRFASFYVLRQAQVPAILVEAGYVSNAEEEKRLRDPTHRARLVNAIADAIETDVASRTAS